MPNPLKPVLHRLDMAVYISDDPSTGKTGAPVADFASAVRTGLADVLPRGVLIGPVSVNLSFDYEASVAPPKKPASLPSDWKQLAQEAGFERFGDKAIIIEGPGDVDLDITKRLELFAKLLLGVK